MLEKLWNDIRFVYENLNFSGLIDNLMIISRDNHYMLYYKKDEIDIKIRVEKNYNLVNMWSLEKGDLTYYNIYVEVGNQIYTSEDSKIELTYKLITPYLRDIRLKSIGI